MPLGFNASWRKPNEREDMHKLHKLTAFLSLVITLAFSATGHACTDNRPTGTAGGAGKYITGIIGTGGPSIRVWWRYAGLGGIYQTVIPFGADSGITSTLGTGHPGYTAQNRVTSLVAYHTGSSHYWQINGSALLEFSGPGLAGVMSVGSGGTSAMSWTGAAGMLREIRGGTVESWTEPGELLGRFEFLGTNSSGVETTGYAFLISSDECEPPVAALARSRRVMLARSFFPEVERVTRQWWQG